MNKIIVADAGPLIAFGRITHLTLLVETLGEIIVPNQVLNECLFNVSLPGAREISEAIDKKKYRNVGCIRVPQNSGKFFRKTNSS